MRKQLRNAIASSSTFFPLQAQAIALAQGQGVRCGDAAFPCPTNDITGAPINLLRLPDGFNDTGGVLTNFPEPFDKMDYDTISFSLDRRFSEKFFMQGSFDYQWRDEVRIPTQESTSPLVSDPIQVAFGQNHSADVSMRQESTTWQFKTMGRYVLPHDIAVSGNVRVTSGWPWAAIQSVDVPGSGTRDIFATDLDQRSQMVPIVDFRAEKAFSLEAGTASRG